MAVFNLGRIKGDTGLKGETGAAGPKGEKGDRGDCGAVPTLMVGQVTTLASGQNARVEINNSDCENPIINFFIPKGQDGTDALGNMMSSVYDTDGKAQDIFAYADGLFDQSVKQSGGTFSGIVKAFSNDKASSCVRNISIGTTLAQTALTGDITLLLPSASSQTLADRETGNIVMIEEDGAENAYIIADKNYHSENTVTLIRKNSLKNSVQFCMGASNRYEMSSIDLFLENIFISSINSSQRKHIVASDILTNQKRRAFIPSQTEITSMAYFTENSKAAFPDGSQSNGDYWLRTPNNNNEYLINYSGSQESRIITSYAYIRPIIVLDGGTCVENTVYNSGEAVKVCISRPGIYVFNGGEWEECAL